ncbi:hypothetical protein BH11ACT7_BH11ACT7_32700 [soil metagenome]
MPAYLIHIATPPPPSGHPTTPTAAAIDEIQGIVESFGGHYRTKLEAFDVLAGSVPGDRLSLIEFPTMADLTAFYTSEQYRPHSAARDATIGGALLAIDSGAS